MPPRSLIDTNIIIHSGSIDEDALRQRMAMDAIEQAGWIGPDGTPVNGVTWSIHRGESRKGGYKIEVRRDIRLSDQPKLAAPPPPTPAASAALRG